MARLITAGAEINHTWVTNVNPEGMYSAGSGTNGDIVTSPVRTGSYAYHSWAATGGFGYWWPTAAVTPSGNDRYYRVWLQFSGTGVFGTAANGDFMGQGSGLTSGYSLRFLPSTKEIVLLRKGGTIDGTQVGSSFVVPMDKYICVMLKESYGTGSTDSAEFRIGYTTIAAESGADSGMDSQTNIAKIGWAGPTGTGNGTIDLYFDDVAVNDGSGTDDNSWPNPNGKVVLALPAGDAARDTWTGGVGGTTSLYDAVNNTPPIGTATETDLTQIEHPGNAGNVGQFVDFSTTSFTILGIKGMRVGGGLWNPGGGTQQLKGPLATSKLATRFRVPGGAPPLSLLRIPLAKDGSPTDNVLVSIQGDATGVPDGSSVWSDSYPCASLSTTPTEIVFSPNVQLTSNTYYWIVVERSGAQDQTNAPKALKMSLSSTPNANGPGTAIPYVSGGGAKHDGTSWSADTNNTYTPTFTAIFQDGDAITCVQLIAVTGEDVATGTKLVSIGVMPNITLVNGSATPGAAPWILSGDVSQGTSGALGTYPTGWWIWRGQTAYPGEYFNTDNGFWIRCVRPETASRVASICFLGLTIEYVERRAPPPIMLHRPNTQRVWRNRRTA